MRRGYPFTAQTNASEVPVLPPRRASCRRLLHRLPGPRRDILSERPLDERHERWSFGATDIGAEGLGSLETQDARAVELDGQFGLRLGLLA